MIPLKDYFVSESIKVGGASEINKIFWNNGWASDKSNFASHLFGDNLQFDLPTKEKYERLQTTGFFRKSYSDLSIQRDNLYKKYETLRRPFNNVMRLSDVMEFSQEAHITGQYDHETQKPEKLTRALILTCSRENDLVVVSFVGSGTECAMAIRENRRFVGFETNQKHCETANGRIRKEMQRKRQHELFSE